ncbi:odaE [Klebsiella pneumoniae]|uniref:defense against restriction DarA-related protein n=2 Tax=Klebsiella pneumoniae TaxID=573 RepID=UPI0025A19E71|nr:odaE [Klebsiella pneumoniae]MDM7040902.1 odaE [Klebsiella pneumoniae]MDM7103872.1 odaE [Klebsiella pneumoniae]MDM7106225.1 odaE [Klebsiella pneumoniae]MDM7117447.1 odaE [Klebsiella pneumoniae]MDM7126425.1 odaE [Klebsiella pneumoniae]
MAGNKYATVDFDQVNEKGLKSLIAAINKTGATVLEVDSSNRATTKDGVKVKTAKLVLQDGQLLSIQVNDTGDISSVKLNGRVIPNAQSPDVKTLGAVMGRAAQNNAVKFRKSLAAKAKRVANPVDKKTAVKSSFQQLQEAKDRNAQLTQNYRSIQNQVAVSQQAITDLRGRMDKETARLNNARAKNTELKTRLKQLRAGK